MQEEEEINHIPLYKKNLLKKNMQEHDRNHQTKQQEEIIMVEEKII